MPSPKNNLGINNSRSPASISNQEHHDVTAAKRSTSGMLGAIDTVVSDSTSKTVVKDNQPIWVVNRDTAVHYIFIGLDSDAPVSVDDTSGLALPAGAGLLLFTDKSTDPMQSVVFKTDSTQVHVTVLKS